VDKAGVLLSKRTGAADAVNYEIGIDSDSYPFARFTSNAGTDKKVVSVSKVQDIDAWHHVAFVYDRDGGQMVLYVDGIRKDREFTGFVPEMSDGDLLIGSDGAAGFSGYIDEVRIWSIARTSAEIAGSMRNELTGAEKGLVSYFRMDDAEWTGTPKYGAQDFVNPNDLSATARGEGDYQFVGEAGQIPELTLADNDNDGLPDYWENANGLSANDATGENGPAGDPDNDGLTNIEEYNNQTKPQEPDTDGDGMADGWEVLYSLNPTTDDASLDPDGDGLSNIEEYLGADNVMDLLAVDFTATPVVWGDATNPQNQDSDADGLPDKWERRHGLDPNSAAGNDGAAGDPDGDTLTNTEEHDNLTDPNDRDTDDDGLPDNWEVQFGLMPTDATGNDGAAGDPDDDGATNQQEFGQGTDPTNRDTDADDLPDGWEIEKGLDPVSAATPNGRNDDPDNDDRTNYEEYLSNTDPLVAEDDTVDSDGDGLTDVQEWQADISTDPNRVDTDDDGVPDFDEVQEGTRGYDSLSKEAIANYVDLATYNGLDYRGNLVAQLGPDDYLEVPLVDTAAQRLAFSSWTIEVRFRVREPGGVARNGRKVLIKRGFKDDVDVNYELGLDDQYRPYVAWNKGGEQIVKASNIQPLWDGSTEREREWVHLAGRFNAEDNTLTLFKDGEVIARRDDVFGYCPTQETGKTPFVRVGEGFAGDIDEVRIWGVPDRDLEYVNPASGQTEYVKGFVRTSQEIAANFDRSVTPTRGVYDGGIRDHFALTGLPTMDYLADVPVTDAAWHTVSGTLGVRVGRVFYEDANGNDTWDPGEDVWIDRAADAAQQSAGLVGNEGVYDDGVDTQVAAGADGWTAVAGTQGVAVTLYFHDDNGSRVWETGEDAWIDYRNTESWYKAGPEPWAEAMGLALYLKFDDAGDTIEDFAWHADWRNFWNHAITPPAAATFKVYDGNAAPEDLTVVIYPQTNLHEVAKDAVLHVRIDQAAVDPDDDAFVYRYRWHQWNTAENTLGTAAAALRFSDDNGDGSWSFGEDVWQDNDGDGTYSTGDDRVTDGGDIRGWATEIDAGKAGVAGDVAGLFTNGNDVWQDDDGAGVFNAAKDVMVTAIPQQTASVLDLDALGAVAGAVYAVSVYAVDEFGAVGAPATDFVTTNSNTSPTAPAWQNFLPAAAQPGQQISVELMNADATETVALYIRWYRNLEFMYEDVSGVAPDVAPGDAHTFTLDAELLYGDVWSFRAFAADANGGLSRMTVADEVRVVGGASVANGAPTAPTGVAISPAEPLESDILSVTATGSVDPEGDAFDYFYEWFHYDAVAGAYTSLGVTEPNLSEAFTAAGDQILCRVYAMDMYGHASAVVSSSVVTVQAEVTSGFDAYEDNDTMAQAHRILPHIDPNDAADPNEQQHAILPTGDVDWFWFLVPAESGSQKSHVIFETNNGTVMFDRTHTTDMDFVDTQLELHDAGGSKILAVDDVGTPGTEGSTRYARFEMDLDPGIYYVKVRAASMFDRIDEYHAHLIVAPAPGTAGPTAPTSVTLGPENPTTADDLVCEAAGATSATSANGQEGITYRYVWYRQGPNDAAPAVVPFGAGDSQPYEGTNYELAHSTTSPVVDRKYTRAGEVWTCKVYALDANGESEGVFSNAVTIGEAAWAQTIRVLKTFDDGTAATEQDVTIGWQFGATHGFDLNIDEELPDAGNPVPPPAPGAGTNPWSTNLPAGRSYSIGADPAHPALTRDIRPYNALTSWFLRIELGQNPVSVRIQWDTPVLPVADTPLTIAEVDENNAFDFVYGSTVDMTESTELIIPEDVIQAMVAEGRRSKLFRISLGGGDAFQKLTLDPGWNLVSFAITPVNPDPDAVFTFNGVKVNSGPVWMYENGGYVAATTIVPKTGYWVYCPFDASTSVTVYGFQARGTIPVARGWNLVGPIDNMDKPSHTSVQGDVWYWKDGAYHAAAAYDPNALKQENVDAGRGLLKGLGYWIYATRRADLPGE